MENQEPVKVPSIREDYVRCSNFKFRRIFSEHEIEDFGDLAIETYRSPNNINGLSGEKLFGFYKGTPVLYRSSTQSIFEGVVADQLLILHYYQPEGPSVHMTFFSYPLMDFHTAFMRLVDRQGNERGIDYELDHEGKYEPFDGEFCFESSETRFKKPLGLKNHPLSSIDLDIHEYIGFTSDRNPPYVTREIIGGFNGEISMGEKTYKGQIEEVCTFPVFIRGEWVNKIWRAEEDLRNPSRPWLNWFSQMGGRYSLKYSGRFID